MNTLRFKTNINCSNCIASVTPFLNNVDSIDEWKVDIENQDKILEVISENGSTSDVIHAVEGAGYEIEEIDNA
jgi:copper chaperone